MSRHLTEEDVREIAEYTRIAVPEDDIEKLTGELNAIIDNLAPITEYNLEGVKPTFHPIGGIVNVMRDDIPDKEFSQEIALENAPRSQDGYFLIPSILGGEEQ